LYLILFNQSFSWPQRMVYPTINWSCLTCRSHGHREWFYPTILWSCLTSRSHCHREWFILISFDLVWPVVLMATANGFTLLSFDLVWPVVLIATENGLSYYQLILLDQSFSWPQRMVYPTIIWSCLTSRSHSHREWFFLLLFDLVWPVVLMATENGLSYYQLILFDLSFSCHREWFYPTIIWSCLSSRSHRHIEWFILISFDLVWPVVLIATENGLSYYQLILFDLSFS